MKHQNLLVIYFSLEKRKKVVKPRQFKVIQVINNKRSTLMHLKTVIYICVCIYIHIHAYICIYIGSKAEQLIYVKVFIFIFAHKSHIRYLSS